MNREAIQEIIDVLRTIEANRFSMRSYAEVETHEFCNTPACMAGWAVLINHKKQAYLARDSSVDAMLGKVKLRSVNINWDNEGRRLLGFISINPILGTGGYDPRADELFYMDDIRNDAAKFKKFAIIALAASGQQGEVRYDSIFLTEEARTYTSPIEIFDLMPADLRRQAGINVLENLLATEEVDWLGAVKKAYTGAKR